LRSHLLGVLSLLSGPHVPCLVFNARCGEWLLFGFGVPGGGGGGTKPSGAEKIDTSYTGGSENSPPGTLKACSDPGGKEGKFR